ncbi:MAG: hypothetical protein WAK26_11190 [Terracidiphilus sp.]
MKSVDRDCGSDGHAEFRWLFAYFFVALGTIRIFAKIRGGIHLHGLPYTLFDIALVSLLFMSPLIFALLFRRYIRSALKEELVSERVAGNCEYWIGQLIGVVYFAFFWFSERLAIG